MATIAFNVLKTVKPEYGIFVTICASAAILIMLSDLISKAVLNFTGIAEKSGLDGKVFSSILKIIGIGYITEFSSGICEDGGSATLAKKIQLAGKLVIFVMALPIVTNIVDIIGELL